MAKLRISVKVECHNERQQGCGKLRKLLELLPEGVAKKSIKIRWAFRLVPQVSVGAGYRHRTRPRLAGIGAGAPSKKRIIAPASCAARSSCWTVRAKRMPWVYNSPRSSLVGVCRLPTLCTEVACCEGFKCNRDVTPTDRARTLGTCKTAQTCVILLALGRVAKPHETRRNRRSDRLSGAGNHVPVVYVWGTRSTRLDCRLWRLSRCLFGLALEARSHELHTHNGRQLANVLRGCRSPLGCIQRLSPSGR